MSKENNSAEMLKNSFEKMKEMIDVSTVIGDPVYTESGLTILPISKVTYGFATGGSDMPSSKSQETFGGAGGGGVTIEPVGFLLIQDGQITVKHLTNTENTAEKVAGLGADVFDKMSGLIKK